MGRREGPLLKVRWAACLPSAGCQALSARGNAAMSGLTTAHHFAKNQLINLGLLAVPRLLHTTQLLHNAAQNGPQLAPDRAELACRRSKGGQPHRQS